MGRGSIIQSWKSHYQHREIKKTENYVFFIKSVSVSPCLSVSLSQSLSVSLSQYLPVSLSGSLSVWVSVDRLKHFPVWWECWCLPAVSYYRKHFQHTSLSESSVTCPRCPEGNDAYGRDHCTPQYTICLLTSTPHTSFQWPCSSAEGAE